MFRFRCENNGTLKLDSPLYARGKADGNWSQSGSPKKQPGLGRDCRPKSATGEFLLLLNFQDLGKCLTSVINKYSAL